MTLVRSFGVGFGLVLSVLGASVAWSQPPKFQIAPAVKDAVTVVGGSPRQSLDLYLPKSNLRVRQNTPQKKQRRTPVMVWIHGGGWKSGSKDRVFARLWVLRHGFALASVGYRLSDEATHPAQANDVRAALAWVAVNADKYGLDPRRIILWGSSAGGHLALQVGLRDDLWPKDVNVLGIVNFYGVTHVPSQVIARRDNGNGVAPGKSPAELMIGGPLEGNRKVAIDASPVTHIDDGDPACLTVHGDADVIVSVDQAIRLDKTLRQSGVRSELEIISGGTHAGRDFFQPSTYARVLKFINSL